MRRLIFGAAVAALLVSLSVPAEAQQLQVGDPIIEFSLMDVNGKQYQSVDYRGKAMVVYLIGYN